MQLQSPLDTNSIIESFEDVIKLQQLLTRQKTLLNSQYQQKKKVRETLQQTLKRYFTFYVNIIKRTTGNQKVRISEQDIFGNTYNFVKEVTLLISKDYTIMQYLLSTQPQSSKLKQLIPSIINILYENSVSDNFVQKDIIKLISNLVVKALTIKIKKLQLQTIQQFFRRPQCRRYGQIVSKNTLLMLSSNEQISKVINDIQSSDKQLFSNLNNSHNIPVLENVDQKIKYLSKYYLNIICNSEFHVPASVRILFKSVQLQRKLDEDKIVSYFWKCLWQIYFDSLKYPIQLQKSQNNNQIQVQNLKIFKEQFWKFKDFNVMNQQNKVMIKKFIKNLLVLPQRLLSQFESNVENQSIKLYASCFSVEQTIILLQSLYDTPHIKDLNQKVATRVSRIYEMSQKFTDFTKNFPPGQIYCVFFDFVFPKSIDLDYMKKYDKFYEQNKTRSLLRQILTTIQQIEIYLTMFQANNFIQLLKRISQDSNEQQSTNTDKVAFFVNIKYFLWMTQNTNINSQIKAMINQAINNIPEWLKLFTSSKILLNDALYYLKGYCQRATQIDNKLRQTILHTSINTFLSTLSFNLCVSSPSSREKQFHTTGKLMIVDYQRILMQKWQNCVHKKFTLKDQLDKTLHVVNFDETIKSFCSLEEVKNSIITGVDKTGINMNLFWFLSFIYEQAFVHGSFKNNQRGLKDYLQTVATKRIFSLIFPKQQSIKDLQIDKKINYFRLLKPSHLGLQLNEIQPIWQLTNKHLNDLNKASSTLKKFDALKQFMKVINGILLINQKTSKPLRLELVTLYALLKSDQKQLASNLYFMQIFTDPARMLSGEGAFIANLKSALVELQTLNISKLIDFDESAYQLEIEKQSKKHNLNPQQQKYIKQ